MTIVAIFQPTEGPLAVTSAKPNDMTVAMAEQATPTGLGFKLVDESEVPTDRTFREAWEWDVDLNDEANNDGVGA